MKNPNMLIDALVNTRDDSGASDDYAKGMVVGLVVGIMAETNKEYEAIIRDIAMHLPLSFNADKLPDAWRADIVESWAREVDRLTNECKAFKGRDNDSN